MPARGVSAVSVRVRTVWSVFGSSLDFKSALVSASRLRSSASTACVARRHCAGACAFSRSSRGFEAAIASMGSIDGGLSAATTQLVIDPYPIDAHLSLKHERRFERPNGFAHRQALLLGEELEHFSLLARSRGPQPVSALSDEEASHAGLTALARLFPAPSDRDCLHLADHLPFAALRCRPSLVAFHDVAVSAQELRERSPSIVRIGAPRQALFQCTALGAHPGGFGAFATGGCDPFHLGARQHETRRDSFLSHSLDDLSRCFSSLERVHVPRFPHALHPLGPHLSQASGGGCD